MARVGVPVRIVLLTGISLTLLTGRLAIRDVAADLILGGNRMRGWSCLGAQVASS